MDASLDDGFAETEISKSAQCEAPLLSEDWARLVQQATVAKRLAPLMPHPAQTNDYMRSSYEKPRITARVLIP